MQRAAEDVADDAAVREVDALVLAMPRQRVHPAALSAEKHHGVAAEVEAHHAPAAELAARTDHVPPGHEPRRPIGTGDCFKRD